MYYLELIEKFWTFNRKNKIGSTAIAMYLYLLKTGFENGRYDFKISDINICKDLGLTRKTVKSIKEKLRSFGLINYQPKNGSPCSYRLMIYYSLSEVENEKFRKEETKKQIKTKEISKKTDNTEVAILISQKFKLEINNTCTPSLEVFMDYVRTLEIYEPHLDSKIESKFSSWKNNGWKNSTDKTISNWKASLKNVLPYLKNTEENNGISIQSIPKISLPKLNSK